MYVNCLLGSKKGIFLVVHILGMALIFREHIRLCRSPSTINIHDKPLCLSCRCNVKHLVISVVVSGIRTQCQKNSRSGIVPDIQGAHSMFPVLLLLLFERRPSPSFRLFIFAEKHVCGNNTYMERGILVPRQKKNGRGKMG